MMLPTAPTPNTASFSYATFRPLVFARGAITNLNPAGRKYVTAFPTRRI